MEGYTIPEAAEVAGVGRRELREAVERGLVPAARVQGRWRLRVAGVEELRGALPPRRSSPALSAGRSADAPGEELRRLRRDLDSLQRRVAALENEREPPREEQASMRTALAPLFGERAHDPPG